MWPLLTITVLLTREVVANFEIYSRDGKKGITNDMSNIFSQEVFTSDFKTLLANILNQEETSRPKNKNEDTSKKEGTIEAGTEKGRTERIEGIDSEKAIITDFEKKNLQVPPWFGPLLWQKKESTNFTKEFDERASRRKEDLRPTLWKERRIVSLLIPKFRKSVVIFDNWRRKKGFGISERVPRITSYPWDMMKHNHNIELKRGSKSNSQKKIPFNSWGGKRAMDDSDFITTLQDDPKQSGREVIFPKRVDQYEKSHEILLGKIEDRRMPSVQEFESWNGKISLGREYLENIISSENYLKTIKLEIPQKRKNRTLRHRPSVFAPWGGKRSHEVASENLNDNSRPQPASFFVRKVFFPWGG